MAAAFQSWTANTILPKLSVLTGPIFSAGKEKAGENSIFMLLSLPLMCKCSTAPMPINTQHGESQTTPELPLAGAVPQTEQMFTIIRKFSALHNEAQLRNLCFSMEIFVSSYSTNQSCQLLLLVIPTNGSCICRAGLHRDPTG